jgi:hypothetical protein
MMFFALAVAVIVLEKFELLIDRALIKVVRRNKQSNDKTFL